MGNFLDPDPPSDHAAEIDLRLAARLGALRQAQGWTLDELAQRSGISRATLSRLERGETSPTASLLGRLCAAFGRTMSRLLAEIEAEPPQLVRRDAQTLWIDPETGFRRHSVSPPAIGYAAELIGGELPPGAEIAYPSPAVAGLEQHIWMLEGRLDFAVDGRVYPLEAGDCLRFHLLGSTRFFCPGPEPARYVIALCRS